MSKPSPQISRFLRSIARAVSLPTRRRSWDVIRAAGRLEAMGCRIRSAHANSGTGTALPTIIIDPPPPGAPLATAYYTIPPGPDAPRSTVCLLGPVRVQWSAPQTAG